MNAAIAPTQTIAPAQRGAYSVNTNGSMLSDSVLVKTLSKSTTFPYTPIITGNRKSIGTTVGYNQAAVRMALSSSAI